MRRFIWLPLLAASLWFTSLPVLAQSPAPPSPPPAGGGQRGQRLQEALGKLNLSAAQKAKIDQILGDSSLQGRERFKAINGVLMPEQQQQLQQLMPHRHHGGDGAPPPQQ